MKEFKPIELKKSWFTFKKIWSPVEWKTGKVVFLMSLLFWLSDYILWLVSVITSAYSLTETRWAETLDDLFFMGMWLPLAIIMGATISRASYLGEHQEKGKEEKDAIKSKSI